MISKFAGILSMKNTKNKIWWMKLATGLILSNVLFFMLFSNPSEEKQVSRIPDGWVEIELEAQLLTPFHLGKKTLLIHRNGRKKIEAVLQASSIESGKLTVMVREEQAHVLLLHKDWEILPYLKNLSFATNVKERSHEIRY